MVKLIGVNKGRRVTLKYFSILIKVSRKHRLFKGPGQSISLICIVVKSDMVATHILTLKKGKYLSPIPKSDVTME